MHIPDINRAFSPGEVFDLGYAKSVVSLHDIGPLTLTSGILVASDFFYIDSNRLTVNAKPGSYPVILSVAHIDTDQRVACAMVRLTQEPVVRWELIGEYFVDYATGCFADMDVAHVFEAHMAQDGYYDYWYALLGVDLGVMDRTYVPTWSWANIPVIPQTQANAVIFTSGGGDGAYPTYCGFDAQGDLACVVTDFDILFPQETDESLTDE